MSKKVTWGAPKIGSAKKAGTYNSMAEKIEKSNRLREEQEKANAYLRKAMPAMVTLLNIRLENGEPLTVMRPLSYVTSVFEKSLEDDIDRSFYNNSYHRPDKFVDVRRVINPGTRIVLKSLDMGLNEFIFADALGKEHPISFDDRNALLTQTDIFETVQKLLEMKENNHE